MYQIRQGGNAEPDVFEEQIKLASLITTIIGMAGFSIFLALFIHRVKIRELDVQIKIVLYSEIFINIVAIVLIIIY